MVGMEPYKRDVYMDAGTLSGDGTRVAVFRDDSDVEHRLRLRVEIIDVVLGRRRDIPRWGSITFERRKRRGGHLWKHI